MSGKPPDGRAPRGRPPSLRPGEPPLPAPADAAADLLDDDEDRLTPGPTTVGDYFVISRLGGGGMADVFLAQKMSKFGYVRRAVIKRVKRSRPGFRNLQRMLLDEARATACFDHPNIVSILDVGEDDQGVYLALEYVDGTDLRWVNAKLRSRKEALPFELACYLSGEVLRGLHHAHNAKSPDGQPLDIVHRDVNPANVLISQTGHVKLADFGVVRMRDRVQQHTEAGLVKGKYGYLAPEYIAGEACNHLSDIYATGIMLFELLSGRECFSGTTTYEVMWKIVNRGVPLYRLEREGVPEDLARIVQKATNPVPERRYSTAQEMANALETWLMRNGKHATPWVLSVFFQRHGLYPERPDQPLPEAPPPTREQELEDQRELMSEQTPAPSLGPTPLPNAGMPPPSREDSWSQIHRAAELKRSIELERQLGFDATTPAPEVGNEGNEGPAFEPTVRLESEMLTEQSQANAIVRPDVPISFSPRSPTPPAHAPVPQPPAPPMVAPPQSDASSLPTMPAISISQDDFPDRPTPIPARSVSASASTRSPAHVPVPPPPPRQPPAFAIPIAPPSSSPELMIEEPEEAPPAELGESLEDQQTPPPVDLPVTPRGTVLWSGKLEEISAAEALEQLTRAGASGSLEFRCGLIWKRVQLDSGAPIAITSNMGMELIGEHLVKARQISRRELDRALHAAERDGQPLTAKLLELALIEKTKLEEELGKNLSARLSEVLEWRWGTFEFTPQPPEPAALRPKLDLREVIARAIEARAASVAAEEAEGFAETTDSDQGRLKQAFKRARSIAQSTGKGRVDQLGNRPPRQPSTKR